MLNLLLLTIIVVFVIDLSGIVQTISEFIGNRLNKGLPYRNGLIPKPFSCSLCMTGWLGLIYLICTAQLTFGMLAYLALLSFLTSNIKDVFIALQFILNKITNKVFK